MTKRKNTTLTVSHFDNYKILILLRRAKKQLPSGLRTIISFFAVLATKRICLKIAKCKIERIYWKNLSVINNKTQKT